LESFRADFTFNGIGTSATAIWYNRLTLGYRKGNSLHVPSARGANKEVVQILRRAFRETVKDPELLSEANKARLEFNPGSGEELEENLRGLLRLERPLVAKLAEILKWVEEFRLQRRTEMLSAIVLLTTERDKTKRVAEALADTEGVSEVYSLAGRYDLAAMVRASDNDQLAEIVTEHIRALPGITSSETLIAFRVYSRHDLERMFSIGLEKTWIRAGPV
jgi:DNA-binding Lrp family transcriptional regulator